MGAFGSLGPGAPVLDAYWASWKSLAVPGGAFAQIAADGANSVVYGAQFASYSGNSIVFSVAGTYLFLSNWHFGNVNAGTRGIAKLRLTPSGGSQVDFVQGYATIINQAGFWDGAMEPAIRTMAVGDAIDAAGSHTDGTTGREIFVTSYIVRLS